MIEWIFAGICIAIGFYLAPLIVSIIVAIFVGVFVGLIEAIKSIIDLFRSKQ